MRLNAWLELTNTSQADLARKLETTPVTVHRIVAGKQNIPLSMADAISRATDGAVTADDLHAAFVQTRAA